MNADNVVVLALRRPGDRAGRLRPEPRAASQPKALIPSAAFDNPILRAIDQLQAAQDARINALFGDK